MIIIIIIIIITNLLLTSASSSAANAAPRPRPAAGALFADLTRELEYYIYIYIDIHNCFRRAKSEGGEQFPLADRRAKAGIQGTTFPRTPVRSVFKISCLLLRPRPWQFEI